ncbi:hypothetical protein C8J56DRAFT_1102765 [Mycena floridula]|nr:hypothetical protein C8J56DRAFT_1102765 [Mycena floridula]
MSTKVQIFLTGATGYIGGSILSLLLEHKNRAHFNITVLVRSEDKAEKIRNATGINVLVGTHQDVKLVEDLASKADVIFSLADTNDVELVKAQLKGSKTRYAITGIQTVFIHIVRFLADESFGMYGPKTVIDDIEAEKIDSIPSTETNRKVDIELVRADQEGYVKTHIVAPGFIYGTARGIVAASGAQKTRNWVFPQLFSFAFERGEAGVLGEGKNQWAHDSFLRPTSFNPSLVSNLVALVYDCAIERPSETGHGREGFYFAENGAMSLDDINQVIQQVLIKTGQAKPGSKVPTTLSQDEISKYMPGPPSFLRIVGSNTACKSSRSRSLGWKPVKTGKDFMESLGEDMELIDSSFP